MEEKREEKVVAKPPPPRCRKRIEKDFNEIHYKGKKAKRELTLPVEEYEEIQA